MLDLFLPFVIGVAIGIAPPEQETDIAVNELPQVEEVPPLEVGSGDDITTREPEAQVPTGKYTTAVEVRPILGMTKSNWAAVRLFNDQDLVYFTHLMGWRCGLWEIRYGINGDPADNIVPMEPCNEEYQQPNVMIDVENFLPYITLPPNSVETVYVEITFDDGTTDFAQFNRNEILIP
ncbi:hypothetical protein [Yoonia sp. 208BN28-4]|uniref:hypothetical protein n=1 Tax=Yoonia sp. 208BN28-4 TaxID=3126505 RepID=UPI0030AC5C09